MMRESNYYVKCVFAAQVFSSRVYVIRSTRCIKKTMMLMMMILCSDVSLRISFAHMFKH